MFLFFNRIECMNMWIITCGKRHDLGRLKGSDGLFIGLLYLFLSGCRQLMKSTGQVFVIGKLNPFVSASICQNGTQQRIIDGMA